MPRSFARVSLACAMYFGSTSVKPQSRSWRAHGPRVLLSNAHQIHLHVLGHVLLVVHVIEDRLHGDVAPLIRRLREQHRRHPLSTYGSSAGSASTDTTFTFFGSRSVSSVFVNSAQPPIIAQPLMSGYAFFARTTSAAASCGVST